MTLSTVLILGGTGEARALAADLVPTARWRVISSLAGRVSAPALPVGEVRLGGFGGPDGLAQWLRTESVRAVVDATHPFAARISASAVLAATEVGVPLLVLRRPGWTAGPGDHWHRVCDSAQAAAALHGRPGAVLLTTGRSDLACFAALDQRVVIRTVDPPQAPLPPHHILIRSRGPYRPEDERALMRQYDIRTLVTKDSGGPMTAAKLTAARELGVRVVMINRPPYPASEAVPIVAHVPAAAQWLDALT